ncbi:hypothetical protein MRX96_047766 [Rhipicephalus microplus]
MHPPLLPSQNACDVWSETRLMPLGFSWLEGLASAGPPYGSKSAGPAAHVRARKAASDAGSVQTRPDAKALPFLRVL